ncbi:MAG: NADH-quinone oxidoreductase subunit N, partial [Acidimicrobiales bacterium]|nr:NADH-quinone oxidoreductase subunit N [Acidimicrobiales bacterium]
AVDGFSALFLVLVSGALMLSALVSQAWLDQAGSGGHELYVLAMLSGSGAMLMASANDLIVIFLGLEIMSIALYVMAGFDSRRAESGEAAIKYFVLGAFSSALFIYGIALVYGATGSTNLGHVARYLAHHALSSNGVLLGGLALLLVGLGFKVAAVPFHAWTPDVYQGSPSPVTGFMAAVAKAGGFAGLLRVFFSTFSTLRADWQPAVLGIAALTLVVGAVLAVVQRDIKRMLAYSSISHAGFVLAGLAAASVTGIAGSLYYLLTYMFMVIGSFAVVTVVGGSSEAGDDIEAYRGLGSRSPLLALSLAILLVAQAGVPCTTGFLGKFYVIAAVVQTGYYWLAILAMVSAVIAAFFYLRVVVVMYLPGGVTALGPGGTPAFGAAGGGGAPGTAGVSAAAGPGPGGQGTPSAPHGLGRLVPALVGATSATATLGEGPGLDPSGNGAEAPARDAGAATETSPARLRVPVVVAVAIAVCVLFTVGFGLIPGPVVHFAHNSTLLLH